MNHTTLLGRLIKDPNLQYNNTSGTAMCRFSIAVDKQLSREKKKELEAKNQPTADFINCVCWGKMAENVNAYTAKGKRILVEGRIQTGSYEAQDGSRRHTTDIVASQVQFIDWKERGGTQSPQEQSEVDFFGDDFTPIDDDRIPF